MITDIFFSEVTCPRTFKLIGSRAQTETSINHSFCSLLPRVMLLNYGLWVISVHIVENIHCLSLAAEEQPAGGKLMHPVGEPGSIDVSASLASTLAGFLFGASPNSWIIFSLTFGLLLLLHSSFPIHLPIFMILIFMTISSHFVLAHKVHVSSLVPDRKILGNTIPNSGHTKEHFIKEYYLGENDKNVLS